MDARSADGLHRHDRACRCRTRPDEAGAGRPRRRAGRPRRRRRSAAWSSTCRSTPRCSHQLHEATGVKAGDDDAVRARDVDGASARGHRPAPATDDGSLLLFGQSVALLRHATTGTTGEHAPRDRGADLPPARALSAQLSSAQSLQVGSGVPLGDAHPARARRRRRAVPDHRVRRAGHGAGAGALDHQLGPRAVHGHRARPAGRLRPPDQHRARRISSASWPSRSTR